MRLGPNVSASLLYGLSWILFCVATLMVILAILTALGAVAPPISVLVDLIGAAICCALALFARFVGRKFERAAFSS